MSSRTRWVASALVSTAPSRLEDQEAELKAVSSVGVEEEAVDEADIVGVGCGSEGKARWLGEAIVDFTVLVFMMQCVTVIFCKQKGQKGL